MEQDTPQERGLNLSPEEKQELSQLASRLTDQWLGSPILDGMDPIDKGEVRTFINTSFGVIANHNLVVNDASVSDIAIATAPGLERRRRKEAFTDKATGLSNSDAFLLARERIDEDPDHGLLFLDLINLGVINNKVSYDKGTETLARAAECIKSESQKLGIDERDIFRVGGDEFGVKVPNDQARYLLYNILREFGEHHFNKNVVTGLRGAYGNTFSEVDDRMKELKQAGKKRWLARKLGSLAGRSSALVTHLETQ